MKFVANSLRSETFYPDLIRPGDVLELLELTDWGTAGWLTAKGFYRIVEDPDNDPLFLELVEDLRG